MIPLWFQKNSLSKTLNIKQYQRKINVKIYQTQYYYVKYMGTLGVYFNKPSTHHTFLKQTKLILLDQSSSLFMRSPLTYIL